MLKIDDKLIAHQEIYYDEDDINSSVAYMAFKGDQTPIDAHKRREREDLRIEEENRLRQLSVVDAFEQTLSIQRGISSNSRNTTAQKPDDTKEGLPDLKNKEDTKPTSAPDKPKSDQNTLQNQIKNTPVIKKNTAQNNEHNNSNQNTSNVSLIDGLLKGFDRINGKPQDSSDSKDSSKSKDLNNSVDLSEWEDPRDINEPGEAQNINNSHEPQDSIKLNPKKDSSGLNHQQDSIPNTTRQGVHVSGVNLAELVSTMRTRTHSNLNMPDTSQKTKVESSNQPKEDSNQSIDDSTINTVGEDLSSSQNMFGVALKKTDQKLWG